MNGPETIPSGGVAEHDADLAQAVASMLGKAFGRSLQVISLRRRPCEFTTLFPAEQITAELSDGEAVSLFVKHLGNEQLDHPDKRQRDRERLVYERLFEPAHSSSLPVPRYYGTHRNSPTGRQQLFLEFIPDWSLKYQDISHWFTAAQRLAHLHGYFAGRANVLRDCDFLLTLDETYFAGWLDRACAAVAARSEMLAARVQELTANHADAARLLARQPPTLVHNDLAPKNVIADRSSAPARICVIDWELAGVGCGLLDLVHLKYGLDSDRDRQMLSAYRSEMRRHGLLPDDEVEFARVVAACELHKTLYRLAHSLGWNLSAETLEQWVAEAEQFMRRVLET